jgi:hypothetical protein
MPKPASSPKRRTPVRTRRVPPSIPAELLADVARDALVGTTSSGARHYYWKE